MRKFWPTLALAAVCALATCAVPSRASEVDSSKKLSPTTTKLKASPTTLVENEKVTLTATVSPSKATGTMTLYGRLSSKAPWQKLGSTSLSHGVAKMSGKIDLAGSFGLKAVYGGSKTYKGSTSNTVTVTVKK